MGQRLFEQPLVDETDAETLQQRLAVSRIRLLAQSIPACLSKRITRSMFLNSFSRFS